MTAHSMAHELRIKALIEMVRRQMQAHEREEHCARAQKMECVKRINELEIQLSAAMGKACA